MLTDRNLIKCLEQLRRDPELGWRSGDEKDAARQALLLTIGKSEAGEPATTVYTWRDYLDYAWAERLTPALRPAMVGMGVFVLVLGGWMTSVSAAYDAVPGDVLYPIKIASEQAQLTLAGSNEKRANLHMEFASRRLAEVSTISASNHTDKDERMKAAVEAFKNEVGEAQTTMESMASEGGEGAAAQVATTLAAKADEFAAVIEQVTPATETTASVQEDVSAAAEAAVEVLVTTAETTPDNTRVAANLDDQFTKEIKEVDARAKMALGRAAVIEAAADLDPAIKLTLTELISLDDLADAVRAFQNPMHEAMNLMAAGGYRRAFTILHDLEATLDKTDAELAELELSIIAQHEAATVLQPPADLSVTEIPAEVPVAVTPDQQTPVAE